MRFSTVDGPKDIEIEELVVAGWTGRDVSAVQHHIDELAEIGVKPPSEVPLFYRASRTLLTRDVQIDVLGAATSGEVEPFVLKANGDLWLGLASDHTDRELEAYSVAASKQACPKPVARSLWRYSEVEGHIDDLILRCHVEEEGTWMLYQEGPLSRIRPLSELLERSGLQEGGAMLCGTLGAIGGVRPASRYRMELVDEKLGRALELAYDVKTLPIVE